MIYQDGKLKYVNRMDWLIIDATDGLSLEHMSLLPRLSFDLYWLPNGLITIIEQLIISSATRRLDMLESDAELWKWKKKKRYGSQHIRSSIKKYWRISKKNEKRVFTRSIYPFVLLHFFLLLCITSNLYVHACIDTSIVLQSERLQMLECGYFIHSKRTATDVTYFNLWLSFNWLLHCVK